MQAKMTKTFREFLSPKFLIFGFTVFYFVWTLIGWLRSSVFYDFHRELFIATALLIAASCVVLNRS